MRFSSAIALASSFAAAALAMTPAIIQPADGTHVAPGQSFPFEYQIIADYGVSSYNYTVYLFTTPPLAFMTSQNYGAGHYFGRFAQPNYPGNPSPSNLPPPKLVMPNFSTSRGGFGAGASASNATYYLAVFEEYATGDGVAGNRISFTASRIIYNATSS